MPISQEFIGDVDLGTQREPTTICSQVYDVYAHRRRTSQRNRATKHFFLEHHKEK